ncbi:MAG: glycosyltransferase family 2 protein [Rikenellaceae bacterium]
MVPKVSVIVPVYNIESLIGRCVESIISQTLSEIEVICVNDGSRDTSLDVLMSFANRDERVKVISQENRGLGGARNRGMDEASGEFILFVDGDDYIEQDYCQKAYDAAVAHSADIVVMGIKKVYPNRTKFHYKVVREACFETTNEKIEAIGYKTLFYVMNKLIRRKALEQSGLRFVERVYFEDVNFTLPLLNSTGRMVTIPDTYYIYVNNSTGITKGRQTEKKQLDKYVAHRALVEYCASENIRLDERFKNVTVRLWTIAGVTILKLKERGDRRVWRLFDLIPIYTKRV